jgi:hypothetical protein
VAVAADFAILRVPSAFARLNMIAARIRLPACYCIASAEAAASSTSATFCCVASSIWMIAWLTSSIPAPYDHLSPG